MATIHEITEDWQREGLSPTWVRLQQAQAEFDALQKQMESQKDEWLSWQAKREGLEADAARYRWLRNEAQWQEGVPQAIIWRHDGHAQEICAEEELDAAIDAAMKGE